jgi:uncharacterized protein YjiS (DUF1127 family)
MQFLSTSTPVSKLNRPTMSKIKVLIFSKLRIFLAAVWRLVQVWKERSCQRRELEQLSTSLLKDIGVSKEDAINEARKPFWKK